MIPLKILAQASADIEDHARYLTGLNLSVALRFYDAFDAACAILKARPTVGTGCRAKGQALRVWPIPTFRKYLIIYRITAERIEIVRVVQGSQNWQQFLGVVP
jgi:plasmid stabilization system protein ParE